MKPRGRRSQTSTTSAEERDILQIRFVDCFIGHGVFAKRKIKNKELVCYYNGELVTGEEGERRLSVANNDGSFLFFFGYRGKHLCIDGTRASGCGRMINDSASHPNCKVKLLEDGGKPKLAIIAIKDIDINNELRFDYGDKSCHWRKYETKKKAITHRIEVERTGGGPAPVFAMDKWEVKHSRPRQSTTMSPDTAHRQQSFRPWAGTGINPLDDTSQDEEP